MLRITRTDEDRQATVLKLEGRLTRRDLAGLNESLASCRNERRRVVLDLAGLGFLDEAGAVALLAARSGDVRLAGASPFVQQLLQEVES